MSVWTIDPGALRHVCPNLSATEAAPIALVLGDAFHRYGIDTECRAAMAVAQWAEESDHFRTCEEYADGRAYERRTDLGNTQAGDGARFKGRGRIMITGRRNYTAMSAALGVDFVAHPELLARSPNSELASGQWWHDNNCNRYCDAEDFEGLTRRINGGLNGYAERCRLHRLALEVASGLVPRDLWAVLTGEERTQMETLAAERRTARRHGGWEHVDRSHLENASTAKRWLVQRIADLEASAAAEPDGWARNNRRRRHDLMRAAVAG
jgi:predicted chitinase